MTSLLEPTKDRFQALNSDKVFSFRPILKTSEVEKTSEVGTALKIGYMKFFLAKAAGNQMNSIVS